MTTQPKPRREKLPREYWVLWAGNLLNRAGGFVNFVLAYFLAVDMGLSEVVTGIVLGTLAAGNAAGALAGGFMADYWSRRATLFVSQIATALSMMGFVFVRDYTAIVVFAALLGLFQGMSRPAFGALLIDVVPPHQRMQSYSLTYWGNNIAGAVAATVGGLLASVDYALAFWIDGVTTVLSAVLIFSLVRSQKMHQDPGEKKSGETGRVPWRDPLFLSWCFISFLMALVFAQHLSTLPLAMMASGLGPEVFGILITVNTVMIVVGQPFMGRLIGAASSSRVLAVSSIIVGLGFGLTAFADTALSYAIPIVIWTFGEMLQNPAAGTLSAGLAPAAARGRYQAFGSMTVSAAMVVAPITGGWIMSQYGADLVWMTCAVLGVACALFHMKQARARDARLEALADE